MANIVPQIMFRSFPRARIDTYHGASSRTRGPHRLLGRMALLFMKAAGGNILTVSELECINLKRCSGILNIETIRGGS